MKPTKGPAVAKRKRKKTAEHPTLPYRPCVGMMVFNTGGLVWAGRRIADGKADLADQAHRWQLPQGGIDKGEAPLQAARRELREETGIRSVSLIEEAPDWIDYDLPAELVGIALKGKYCGQTQRWFAFRFEGDDSEIAVNPPPDGHKAEFDMWAWMPMAELPDRVVPFKRAAYRQVIAAFSHLAGRPA